MDALFIVSGVIAVLIAWVWLVLSARSLGVVALLIAIFLPWLTLVLRRRDYAPMPRLLLLMGVASIVLGVAWLHRDQPERFQLLLAGDWVAAGAAQGTIEGELMGQRFVPDRVFWNDSELVLTQGEGERLRRSLTIRFANAPDSLRHYRVERLPGDQGPGPELVIQWHTGALKNPGLRRVVDGYTMNLEFNPQADGRTRLSLHLHLPSQDATRLTGEAWLEVTPVWLEALDRESVRPRLAVPGTPPVVQASVRPPTLPQLGPWQTLSLLALLDEPELFVGQNVRLVTSTGRVYEGRLNAVNADQRVVIGQSRGPNQVDYHFHPLDIHSLEVRYRSTR